MSKLGSKVLQAQYVGYDEYTMKNWILEWEEVGGSAIQTAYPGAALNGGWSISHGDETTWTLEGGGTWAISEDFAVTVNLGRSWTTTSSQSADLAVSESGQHGVELKALPMQQVLTEYDLVWREYNDGSVEVVNRTLSAEGLPYEGGARTYVVYRRVTC